MIGPRVSSRVSSVSVSASPSTVRAAQGARSPAVARPRTTRPVPSRARAGPIIEFVFLGILMLVPLTYLVLTMARLQAGRSPPLWRVVRPGGPS